MLLLNLLQLAFARLSIQNCLAHMQHRYAQKVTPGLCLVYGSNSCTDQHLYMYIYSVYTVYIRIVVQLQWRLDQLQTLNELQTYLTVIWSGL